MMYIGVDIGGTSVKVGLVDDTGHLFNRFSFPFVLEDGIDGVMKIIHDRLDELCADHCQPSEIEGIGVSVPGSISKDKSTVLNAYNLGFHDTNVRASVEKVFGHLPFAVCNDADAAALAELSSGIFKGLDTAILLTIGTGLGGGVILNGHIFTGGNGRGTEPGHMLEDFDGPYCTCGNRGCMEVYCNAGWLTTKAKEAPMDSLIKKDGETDVDAKSLMDAAKLGDPYALSVFNQYIDQFSSAIASIIAILDPQMIGIGGGVSETGEFLLEPLRKQVQEKNFFKAYYPIEKAKYGNTAGMIGAAELIRFELHGS